MTPQIEAIYRSESRRVLATLIRLLGDFDLAEAPSAGETDWLQIVGLYNVLLRQMPSPVIELNRAVAVAMRDGPLAGLQLVEGIVSRGELLDYHLAHSARGEFCRQLGRIDEAEAAYEKALTLTQQTPEKSFLKRRLAELKSYKQ